MGMPNKKAHDRRRNQGLPLQLKYAMILTLVAACTSLVMIFVMGWFIQRNYNLFMGDELGLSAQVIEVVRHEQQLLELTLFSLFLISTTMRSNRGSSEKLKEPFHRGIFMSATKTIHHRSVDGIG